MDKVLRIAVLGTGYWAQFQIAAWQAIGCEVVAVWNRTRQKAEETARRHGIPAVYDSPAELFDKADFDIADIITDVDAHESLVLEAARHGKAVICQKPLAMAADSCRRMVAACEEAGVWFAVHENFRYQPQFVSLKEQLDSAGLGRVLHAHIQLKSPDRDIIAKQPALANMPHMALRDMGPHLFDIVRFLFGEIDTVLASPISSYPDIPVDDSMVALLNLRAGHPVLCTLAHDFAYKAFIACERGTLLLDADNNITITSGGAQRHLPYPDRQRLPYIPADDWRVHGGHVFLSIPACLMDLKKAYLTGQPAPTSGSDNLNTMLAVFAAIQSVTSRQPERPGAGKGGQA